ncbi:hypothetical protein VTK73DRAFT_4629 [Phialemonium thermophilum]|uniref:Uncharacterized protein n=1 Tax=Phialemonium thermophilum TaxID=223376 RepID=A0ABR3V781_9PEZI
MRDLPSIPSPCFGSTDTCDTLPELEHLALLILCIGGASVNRLTLSLERGDGRLPAPCSFGSEKKVFWSVT